MSLNDTVRADRIHIAFFGRRNAGKSSLVNAVTDQDMAIVSAVKGTTTDPVYKSMELLPLGPVVIIDTPGYDDEGELGALRVLRTEQVMNKTDIGILVIDMSAGIAPEDLKIYERLKAKTVPFIVVFNKCDSAAATVEEMTETLSAKTGDEGFKYISVSAVSKENIFELKELIGSVKPDVSERRLVADLISPKDVLILVMPQDEAAPKGRLILPQVQMIRDILDEHAMAFSVQTGELEAALGELRNRPKLVITDSQVFKECAKIVPEDVELTSFSILLARYKGYLDSALKGIEAIKKLTPSDRVLIAEGCTHHRQCNDIGTVKIPRWLKEKLGFEVNFDTCSGYEFPDDLSGYKAVIHCGGCMLSEREIGYRIKCAADQGVPVTNYGILIAYIQGILDRSIKIFS